MFKEGIKEPARERTDYPLLWLEYKMFPHVLIPSPHMVAILGGNGAFSR